MKVGIVFCFTFCMVKISTNLFSGVGMSLGLGLLDSDINRGWRDTVFSRDGDKVEPLSRNGDILDLQLGPA